ncbi:MAG: PLDc_N domain-containing protein [Nocardioidaceae bacterium]|nr:PLDc_N domain-containing protein [Nocardioidaceae bacterium]
MRFLPAILLIVIAIYCWVEIAQSDPRQVRQLSRGMWALVVLVPLAGPVAWLIGGRPNGEEVRKTPPRPRPRVIAPDDDPDFLRGLNPRPAPPEDGDHPSKGDQPTQ